MEIVFATNNENKLREIRQIFDETIKILSLADINCVEEIPEEQPTIEGNASQKAFYLFNKYGYNCFADDTGLEVEALDGAPGVYSARYAGAECLAENNINKVLTELKGKKNRKARFKTVVSLVIDGKEWLFEGIVNGTIIEEKVGGGGFGYDPIFRPDGHTDTFSQMPSDLKNSISHRGLAVKKLVEYLKTL